MFVSMGFSHDWSKGYPEDFTKENIKAKREQNYQNNIGKMRKIIYETMWKNPNGERYWTRSTSELTMFRTALNETNAVETIDCYHLFPGEGSSSWKQVCYRVKE